MDTWVREIADRKRWPDATLLGLILEYVESQRQDDALVDFLKRCAGDDEAESAEGEGT